MIADSHCHAWRRWPYAPPVPDPESHGSIGQLRYEMDKHGVDHAAVVCARIGDGADANEDNNEYVATAAARHPDRFSVIADVDSSWRPEHHTRGAADRLRRTADELNIAGFTHYVKAQNDGWFRSDEGREFFAAAAELDLVASLALSPAWHADLRSIAQQFPTLPILVHHLGALTSAAPTFPADLEQVLASAGEPNIMVKVSGFHYACDPGWDFPFPAGLDVLQKLFTAYGARRLCWGSDFPAAKSFVTYTQSLEVVRSHCDFLSASDLDLILGDNLMLTLDTRRPPVQGEL